MKNCVIVTSVIAPDNAPLAYTETRSIYSNEERFTQTLETISSIRKYIPNSDICLIECSPPSVNMEVLRDSVDFFENIYPDDVVRKSPHKGIGEAMLLLTGMNKLRLTDYANIFKLTGRYTITEKFLFPAWDNTNIVGKVSTHYGQLSVHTFFYKFPQRKFALWIKSLEEIVATQNARPPEHIIFDTVLKEPFQNIDDNLGVLVRWGCFPSVSEM